jgi:hypothetical protein
LLKRSSMKAKKERLVRNISRLGQMSFLCVNSQTIFAG